MRRAILVFDGAARRRTREPAEFSHALYTDPTRALVSERFSAR
jgi:hypothetical protein